MQLAPFHGRSPHSRRAFLSSTVKAAALVGSMGLRTGSQAVAQQKDGQNRGPRIHVFSKHLQWLDYRGMAEAAAEIGFDGVDLTVRPRGHVLPERVEDDLPRAVEAVKQAGLRVEMIVSTINDPRDKHTDRILRTAGGLGIRYYRMGYHHFSPTQDIFSQLNELKPLFRDLAAMNKQYGLAASHQNHAGEKYVGAGLWDLHHLIHDLDRRWMGAQYDIRHAVAEGGTTWTVTLRMLAAYINTMVVKDFLWGKRRQSWFTENVPLGQGMVDFPKFATLVKQLKIVVPVSLHLEYPLGGADHGHRELSVDKSVVFEAMRRDLRFCRDLFAG